MNMSQVMPREIKSVHVSTRGDMSVGLPGMSATMAAAGSLIDLDIYSDEDRPVVMEEFRAKLGEAFAVICDEAVTVRFDFEVAAGD